VALNWVIHGHGEAVVAIPGATKVHQARESAGAMQFRLSAHDIAQLNELSRF
jgi:aryl-alcohol dehydrogenase-like predicted oxidoreductase